MKSKLIFICFVGFALLQMLLPLTGVFIQEDILRNGKVYKFKTEPIDPYDPFRGKYVTLRIKDDVAVQDGEKFEENQKVYAVIEKYENGFAYVAKLAVEKPKADNYFITHINSVYSTEVSYVVPFTRYYLDEKKAPQAERAYFDNSRREEQNTYIQVRVKNGKTALEELYISDLPVLEYIKQATEE
jgi:uncharacterized membrane-anchored protein